ncbi:MAG: cytochrome c3 family protein [Gemmatimonadota bacterium]|nr:MAG: cytochrome c3 family protein [Gemmatimonadota bacterium]
MALVCAAVGLVPVSPHMVAGAPGWQLRMQQQSSDTTYGCLICHAEKRRTFTIGIHSEHGIRCHNCHGGDPASFERGTAHGGRFLGDPDKLETVQLCSSCHADADQMRQYGLPAGQLAEFRTSRHGQLLLERSDQNAPTCTDCHDAHTILPPEDARSNVHPTNIPATCARCHDNAEMMDEYGIPINQFAQYRESEHGKGIFERANFAAPTCTSCHGSHAALPPGVTEIVNVCEKCHVLVGREFRRGPHDRATRDDALPGCLGCHSNHGTEGVPPDGIAALCTNCHEPDSRAQMVGVELQEGVIRSLQGLAASQQAIEEMAAAGHQVADERFRYQTALTSYREMAQVHHSLDMELLEDLGRQVRSDTELIRATAEAAAERRWERKLILLPVWFLTLSAVTFAWFKLRELEG